jgi:imidazoleglycerol-phosphate dehydratase
MRKTSVKRKTSETDIDMDLCLDGRGNAEIDTGVGFLDHMLTLFARHGFFDLTICARGDIEVDYHHTVEDVGISLGDAFAQSLGEKKGIARYGSVSVPMDEAKASVCVDMSNRPYLVFRVGMPKGKAGNFDLELVEEFFRAFAVHAGATLHIELCYGENFHHCIEAIFKAFGRAMNQAVVIDDQLGDEALSTKGVL